MAAGESATEDILFTDEKMFTAGVAGKQGGQYLRVHVHTSIEKAQVPAGNLARGQGAQEGGARVMVGARLSYRGKGTLCTVEPGAKINQEA